MFIRTFFKKILADTCPFLGPLISMLRTTGDISSRFQSQSGQPYSLLAEAYMIYVPLRFPSIVTPLPVYVASIVIGHFPHMHDSAEVGCRIRTRDGETITQKSDALTIQAYSELKNLFLISYFKSKHIYYSTLTKHRHAYQNNSKNICLLTPLPKI